MPKSHDNDTWKSVNNLKLIPPFSLQPMSPYKEGSSSRNRLMQRQGCYSQKMTLSQPAQHLLENLLHKLALQFLSTMGIKVLYFKIVKKKAFS